MLDISNLVFNYPGKKEPLYDGLSISLPQGHVYGLLGKNGSGKSTLLYLISGLLRPKKGTIRFMGEQTILRLPSILSNMFILPEEFSLPKCDFKTFVRRNAVFYPRFSEEMLHASLDEFEMPYDMPLNELSMGNKKKAYVCFALATNVSLLLMDEPTNGLDIPSKSQFRRAIARTMTNHKSVIISTHQVRDVDTLLDHITIIDSGRILLNSTTAALQQSLTFDERGINESTDDAIFTQQSLKGNKVICRNDGYDDTPFDLELLFSAAVGGKADTINAILDAGTNK